MPVDRDELVKQLTKLRQRDGVTLRKLEEAPLVLEALGHPGSPTAARDLLEMILNDPRRMSNPMNTAALKNAYGYGVGFIGNLTSRRGDFAVENDKDPSTIEDYENRAIEELATALLAGSTSVYERETLSVEASVVVMSGFTAMVVHGQVHESLAADSWKELADPERLPTSSYTSPALYFYKTDPNVYLKQLRLQVLFMPFAPAGVYATDDSTVLGLSAAYNFEKLEEVGVPEYWKMPLPGPYFQYSKTWDLPPDDHYFCIYWGWSLSQS